MIPMVGYYGKEGNFHPFSDDGNLEARSPGPLFCNPEFSGRPLRPLNGNTPGNAGGLPS
jgi:hypothetical protein